MEKTTAQATAKPVEAKSAEAEALNKKKAAKAEAAKRFKERRAQEKAERVEKAKAFIDEAKKQGIWDKLSANAKAFIEGLATPVAAAAGGTTSFFTKVFGPNAKVGDSKTLRQIFEATLQGQSKIDAYVKKWKEDGTIVEYKEDAKNVFESTYTIKAIAQ